MQLRGDLDELDGDAGSGLLQSGDIELRQKEMDNIARSIDDIKEQIEGAHHLASEQSLQLTAQNRRRRL